MSEQPLHREDEQSCSDSAGGCGAFEDDQIGGNESMETVRIIELQDDYDWGVGRGVDDEDDVDDGDPTKATIRKFRAYVMRMRDNELPIDAEMASSIELMDVLARKKAPLDAYDEVMAWHKKEMGQDEGFESRHTVIKFLARRHNWPKELVKQSRILLPSSQVKVNIIHHEFEDMVASILTDPRFGDEDFLHFGNDPLAGPPDDLDHIADINTGRCYIETHKKLITKPGRQMLVPIVWYLDGAATGQFNALNVEALKFTIGILNRRARDKECAWRTLGYVPNITKHDTIGEEILREAQHVATKLVDPGSGSEESDDEDEQPADSDDEIAHQDAQFLDCDAHFGQKTHRSQDLHRALAEIMKSHCRTEHRGMVWDYKHRGKLYKNVELVFFSAFVKCDTEEADKLCGSYTARTSNVSQLCRHCCCPTAESSNPDARCPAKTVKMISNLVNADTDAAREKLQKLSQQDIHNAFHLNRFGAHDETGIHGACPMEMLHHLLLGVFKTVRDCFFTQIGDKSQQTTQINGLARVIGRFFQHQSDRDMPKTHFSKGTSEGKIQGKEFCGILLNMAAIFQTAKGREILKSVRAGKDKGGMEGHFKEDWLIDDWGLLVETLLEWEAFLKMDNMSISHVKKLKEKHKCVMFLVSKVARRVQGMGLNIMKFHGMLHMFNDTLNFGVPNVVDTGSNESHHKKTKVAAKLTQRDIRKFEEQTGVRIVELLLLELAMLELEHLKMFLCLDIEQPRGLGENDQVGQKTEQVTKTGGTAIQVIWDEEKQSAACRHRNAPKTESNMTKWDSTLVDFLYRLSQQIGHCENLSDLDIRTEHTRKGAIFRGHPDYRGNGQWNDWAIFDWGRGYGKLPGEIWCFVDLSDAPGNFNERFADCQLQRAIYAVVESSYCCPNVVLDKHGNEVKDEMTQEPVPMNNSNMFAPIIKEGVTFDHQGRVAQRRFYLADVESIVAPTVVMPDIGNKNRLRCFVVEPRENWAKNFMKWLDAPSRMDRSEMDRIQEEEKEEPRPTNRGNKRTNSAQAPPPKRQKKRS